MALALTDKETAESGTALSKWKRTGLGLLMGCALVAGAYVWRAPLLAGAAKAWIVNERLDKADAIVVLGGGLETRPFEAARLYHQGFAPKILVMNPKPSPVTTLGISPSEAELARQVILKQGVREADVVVIGDEVTNTFDESVAVRNWARTNGVKRVIVTTDLFHTRRVRWLFRKQLKPAGIQVIVNAAEPRDYTAADWWRRENGIVAFQNEILKYAYYRIKY